MRLHRYLFVSLFLLTAFTVAYGGILVRYNLESNISTSTTVCNLALDGWGDGTAVNGGSVISGAVGIVDKAFHISAMAAINTGNKLPATGNFTLSGWVKIAQTSARSILFGQYVDAQPGRMVFFSSDNNNGSKARVYIAGGVELVGTTTIDDGQWHYLVLTRLGDTFILYIDGIAEAQASVGGISIYQGVNLCVGNLATTAGGQIVTDGIIDEVAVYDYALSTSEVADVYGFYTGIKQYYNIPYADEHFRQKLDIFRPADNPNAPLIVIVHGGGWFRGERAWGYQDAIFLAQRGYSVACIGYRLLPDYPDWSTKNSSEMWENMKLDLMRSLQFLVDNAEEYGIDASKAITIGSSAGGHLALALRNRAAAWVQQGVVSRAPAIVGVVAHCPVSDMTKFKTAYSEALKKNVPPQDIDPIQMTPENFEGALIVHGDNDTSVPISHSMGFIDVMDGQGVDAKLAIVPGAEHSFLYELGLDVSLSPYGYWPQPPRVIPVEHGHVGFNATMVCVKNTQGYDLPYTPFDEPLQYYYYGDEPPVVDLKPVMPLAPLGSWLFDGDLQPLHGEITGVSQQGIGFAGDSSGLFNYVNNSAVELDGVGEYVNFGNDEILQITDKLTVSLWLKRDRDSSNSSIQYILSKWDYQDAGGGTADNNNRGWMIFEHEAVSSEVIGVQVSADGTNNNRILYWNNSDVDAFDNQWHHVAFTFNSGDLRFYLDGKRLLSSDLGTMNVGTVNQIYNTTDVVSLGAVTDVDSSGDLQGADRFCGGVFDEVGIWNIALSEEEIYWLYNNSIKSFDVIGGDTNADGIVDLNDFATLAANWLSSDINGGFTAADFDGNRAVDFDDMHSISGSWLNIELGDFFFGSCRSIELLRMLEFEKN